MSDTILVESKGPLLQIVLNRPEVFNAFNDDMGERFLEALGRAGSDQVRCVVITGAGRAFCAGEDLRALASDYASGTPPDHAAILKRRYNPAIESIRSLDKPVVAGINGVAAGAGVSLALACDLRVIAEGAKLAMAFSKVGLVPDSGATWLLPKYLGVGRAMELALSGDPITADRALDLGLVNKVVAESDFTAAVGELGDSLANGPTRAFALTKGLIWKASGGQLKEHLSEEADAQRQAGATEDHLEGIAAFGEKRPAVFKGR